MVASLLALFTLVRRGLDWLQERVVWQWLRTAGQEVLAALPDLRLPFDLTLPEAVAAAASWVWSVLLPGLSTGVLLPLLWLALTATVLGWPDPRASRLDQLRARVARPGAYAGRPARARHRPPADQRPADQVPAGAPGAALRADRGLAVRPRVPDPGHRRDHGPRLGRARPGAAGRAAAGHRHPGLVGGDQPGRRAWSSPRSRSRSTSPRTPGSIRHRRNSTST